MNLNDAKQFVAHFITGEYDPEEYEVFLQWLKWATTDELNAIADEHEALQERWSLSSEVPSPEWIAQLEQKLDRPKEAEVPVVPMYSGRSVRRRTWMAAASIVVLVAAGGAYWYHQSGSKGDRSQVREALTNVFTNPAGHDQRELDLADGSKIWLNAASTVKYPLTFSGKERVVELSGEAFFEIAKNPAKPFRVLIKGAEVEVLGTQFNIMAYESEPVSRTTLIEGAVNVSNGSQTIPLKPGQQAEVIYEGNASTSIRLVEGVSTDADVAWRNGVFQFKSDDLPTVMREIARCYNVDIELKDKDKLPNSTVTGIFKYKDGLEKNLDYLGESLHVHFIKDGNKVIVEPMTK